MPEQPVQHTRTHHGYSARGQEPQKKYDALGTSDMHSAISSASHPSCIEHVSTESQECAGRSIILTKGTRRPRAHTSRSRKPAVSHRKPRPMSFIQGDKFHNVKTLLESNSRAKRTLQKQMTCGIGSSTGRQDSILLAQPNVEILSKARKPRRRALFLDIARL